MGRLGANEAANHDEDCHVCGCDFEVEEGEATPDDELPAAYGGVQIRANHDCSEELIDGCDLDFNTVEPTNDDALPAARGGVK